LTFQLSTLDFRLFYAQMPLFACKIQFVLSSFFDAFVDSTALRIVRSLYFNIFCAHTRKPRHSSAADGESMRAEWTPAGGAYVPTLSVGMYASLTFRACCFGFPGGSMPFILGAYIAKGATHAPPAGHDLCSLGWAAGSW